MNKARQKLLLLKIQQEKDENAFTQLYEAFVDQIYRFLYFKTNDVDLAQDLTSEVFIRCWKDLQNPDRKIDHLKAYIYTVARNRVIDHYRTNKVLIDIYSLKNVLPDDKPGIADKIDKNISYQEIRKLLTLLKDSYQEILILHHIEELSLREISEVLKKSPSATRVLLHRANKALKREYEKSTK